MFYILRGEQTMFFGDITFRPPYIYLREIDVSKCV
jgi:hypothetical protein